eukprot:TRINITY_DN31341_c0_g1_i1.p1 TRINITY_DN31341_c0_g1~~TRINITY_DN31341_c0_g1_i1.p1  ORF type:complete len:204 (+),score=26.61 TRINITY_DN31341_c0_g1_i1:50-661(+)
MPHVPKFQKELNMGASASLFAEQFREQVQAENKAAAAHIMDSYGQTVNELLDGFNLHQSLLPSKKGGKPKLGFKGPPPILSPTKATIGPYDASLTQVQGLGKETRCHAEIGGAADHHVTHWGHASMPSTPFPPSRGGSQVSLRRLPESRAGRSIALSRRSKGSQALSAATSMLLTERVEEAVRKEISRLTSPASKTSANAVDA